jgi:hypothetical protein
MANGNRSRTARTLCPTHQLELMKGRSLDEIPHTASGPHTTTPRLRPQ